MNYMKSIMLIVNLNSKMLRLSLFDCSDADILVSETIRVPNTAAAGAAANNSKIIIIKNCAPFTNCIIEINNTQIDNTKDTDRVMPMHNLIEYSDNYFKTSGRLWHYYGDEPFLDANGDIASFPANNNNSTSFIVKLIVFLLGLIDVL